MLIQQGWLQEEQERIVAAYREREELNEHAKSFNARTPSWYIDKHRKIFSDKETWIRDRESNKQKILNMISTTELEISQLKLDIDGLQKSKETAYFAFKKFEKIFTKDYRSIETDIKRLIAEELREYGY
jgi:hypothetical protein